MVPKPRRAATSPKAKPKPRTAAASPKPRAKPVPKKKAAADPRPKPQLVLVSLPRGGWFNDAQQKKYEGIVARHGGTDDGWDVDVGGSSKSQTTNYRRWAYLRKGTGPGSGEAFAAAARRAGYKARVWNGVSPIDPPVSVKGRPLAI